METKVTEGKDVRDSLIDQGYSVLWIDEEEACKQWLGQESFDALILEIAVVGQGALDLVEYAKKVHSSGIVVCLAEPDEMEIALDAVEKGAEAYIKKPFDVKELEITLRRLFDHRSQLGASAYLRRRQDLIYRFDDIIGESPALKEVISKVREVAYSDTSVLIVGEPGTGKDVIAGAIHYNSARKDKNFIKVNCAVEDAEQLESELFGHDPEAFPEVSEQRAGSFELAKLGTIFLERIDGMPAETRSKLIRALRDGEFERVGGSKPVGVDVRVLSAADKDLQVEVEAGRFSAELHALLGATQVRIPPLRSRPEDIMPLSYYFLRRFAGEFGKPVIGFNAAAREALEQHQWPGNIRELRNTVERAVLLSKGESVRPEDLSLG